MARACHRCRSALVLLVAVAGCAGEVANPDVGTVDTFVWDTQSPDRTGTPEAAPPPDTGPRDQGPPEVDGSPGDGMTGPCRLWSAWTCDDNDPVFLCKATCAAGGLGLNCINSGDCICGVGTGSCGKFSGDKPCEVCRAALEAGCCTN